MQGAAAAALNRPVPTPPAPCKALWASVSVCRGPALPEMSRNNQKNIDAAQQSTPFAQNETEWKCACGQSNQGKFCSACGAAAQRAASKGWRCTCGKENDGNFCTACGSKRPEELICQHCGTAAAAGAKFCAQCGKPLTQETE